jgi:C_GCAxxG_C_C family probable redox protein
MTDAAARNATGGVDDAMANADGSAGSGDTPYADPARMTTDGALTRARSAFLDTGYGCAEATFITLKVICGLPDPDDSSPAMAFNGGIAWTGGPCGAITGAAIAIGELAGSRISDRARAKRVARELVAGLMERFHARYGALACRDLIGMDLRAPGAHQAFLDAGAWRTTCMVQIESVVRDAARLADPAIWDDAVAAVEASIAKPSEAGERAPMEA